MKPPAYPPPSVTFQFEPHDAIHACARLDFMEEGLRVDINEVFGHDKFIVTVSRNGLRVGFDCSFHQLHNLEQTLRVVRQKIHERAERALGASGFKQGATEPMIGSGTEGKS